MNKVAIFLVHQSRRASHVFSPTIRQHVNMLRCDVEWCCAGKIADLQAHAVFIHEAMCTCSSDSSHSCCEFEGHGPPPLRVNLFLAGCFQVLQHNVMMIAG